MPGADRVSSGEWIFFATVLLIVIGVFTIYVVADRHGRIAHDFNDGLSMVTVMLAHGNPPRRSVLWLLVDMSAPVLGAASTALFEFPPGALPWLLAFFTGVFLYIGTSDLLPEAREHDSPVVGLATAAGMLVMFSITRVLPR